MNQISIEMSVLRLTATSPAPSLGVSRCLFEKTTLISLYYYVRVWTIIKSRQNVSNSQTKYLILKDTLLRRKQMSGCNVTTSGALISTSKYIYIEGGIVALYQTLDTNLKFTLFVSLHFYSTNYIYSIHISVGDRQRIKKRRSKFCVSSNTFKLCNKTFL